MEQLIIEKFSYLTDQYIEIIINLIDFCEEKKILPKKLINFLVNKFSFKQNQILKN